MVLNVKSLSMALGVLHGLLVFVLTIVSMILGSGSVLLDVLTVYCPMYTISILGAIVGLIYGFVHGFIIGYVFGTLYSFFEG